MKPTLEAIVEAAAAEFDVNPAKIRLRHPTGNEAIARGLAIMLAYDYSGLRICEIAAYFDLHSNDIGRRSCLFARAAEELGFTHRIEAVIGAIGPIDIRRTGPNIEDIRLATAEVCGLTVQEIVSSSRCRAVARSRQIAMAVARKLTKKSTTEIARQFSKRDHTTVIAAEKRIAELSERDPAMRLAVSSVSERALELAAARVARYAAELPSNPPGAAVVKSGGTPCPGSVARSPKRPDASGGLCRAEANG